MSPASLKHFMDTRFSRTFKNSTGKTITVIVEPWATEFALPPKSECEVFSIGGTEPRKIDMEQLVSTVIFHVETAGAIYEYWQDGVRID